jgi:acyl-coenzyme A thioesterase PaaI-like protein
MKTMFNPMARPNLFRFIMNSWPPFLGAGIRVDEISNDWKQVRVGMKLHWYNRNYVRTHFGGSLFAMTDPFLMLMLMANLGKEYVVWDSSSKIKFIQPGRGRVTANFVLDEERLALLRDRACSGEKMLEKFRVDVFDTAHSPVARVYKTVYIRRKK